MAKGEGKGKQGFASMDPDKARQIQSMGGKASHGGGRTREDNHRDDNRAGNREKTAEAGSKGNSR